MRVEEGRRAGGEHDGDGGGRSAAGHSVSQSVRRRYSAWGMGRSAGWVGGRAGSRAGGRPIA